MLLRFSLLSESNKADVLKFANMTYFVVIISDNSVFFSVSFRLSAGAERKIASTGKVSIRDKIHDWDLSFL